jgi:hypothetical protein
MHNIEVSDIRHSSSFKFVDLNSERDDYFLVNLQCALLNHKSSHLPKQLQEGPLAPNLRLAAHGPI